MPNTMRQLMTEREVAVLVGVHRDTLRRWRREGQGPPWLNLAHRRKRPIVRYDPARVREWLAALRAEEDSGGGA